LGRDNKEKDNRGEGYRRDIRCRDLEVDVIYGRIIEG
jgi:hypothetical protein